MIRPFGLHDITVMRQLQKQSVPLDLRRQVLYRDAPARAALIGYSPTMPWAADLVYILRCTGRTRSIAAGVVGADRSDWTLSACRR